MAEYLIEVDLSLENEDGEDPYGERVFHELITYNPEKQSISDIFYDLGQEAAKKLEGKITND